MWLKNRVPNIIEYYLKKVTLSKNINSFKYSMVQSYMPLNSAYMPPDVSMISPHGNATYSAATASISLKRNNTSWIGSIKSISSKPATRCPQV